MAAVLRWMFVLVLLFLVAGSGTAYWLYYRSDEGLKQLVLKQLNAMAPDLKFDIVRAQADMMGRVYIYGLTASLPDDPSDQPSLEVPELIATLEPGALTDFENVVIQKVRVVKPVLNIVRTPDGQWNWKQVHFQSTGATPPDLEIEQALMVVECQLNDRRSRTLKFQDLNLSSHPLDSQRMLMQVATVLKPAGPLTMEVEAAVDGSMWKVASRDPWRIPVDGGLLQLLSDLSPQIETSLRNVGRSMGRLKAAQDSGGPLLPEDPADLPRDPTDGAIPDFGVNALCNVNFLIEKEEPTEPFTFRVLTEIEDGDVNNPLMPLAFKELKGKIYLDRNQIIVSGLRALRGPTQINLDCNVVPGDPISVKLAFRNVELNKNLMDQLPEVLRKIVAPTGLTGVFDTDINLTYDGTTWNKRIDLRLSRGTVTHERFPVTVRDVSGKLHVENRVVDFTATGNYAGQPINVSGTVTHMGPGEIRVKASNLPIDDESLAACPPQVMNSIKALNLTGRHDLMLKLTRANGSQKFEPELYERVHDASLCFNGFKYAIQLSEGFVSWKGDVVKFHGLKGTHDDAKLTGSGRFLRTPAPGRLELNIEVVDGEFDRSLERALPANLRRVWENFQPLGTFDATTEIGWTPGSPCEVVLPSVKVRDGEILMKCFAWLLHNLEGEFSYNTRPGLLVIKRVIARHDDTEMCVSGTGSFVTGKPWKLTFDQLDVDNLIPNVTFRNALPPGLQRTYDVLRPSGAFSFYGPVEFSGSDRDDSLKANWKLRSVLSRCAINAGSRIDEINGVIQVNGSWDGQKARFDGDLDLDSVSVFRQPSGRAYQITRIRGPILFEDDRFVAGFEDAIPPRQSDTPPDDKRIRGEMIDGTVFLDSVVTFGNELNYRLFLELKNGRLERFAQQYLRGQSKLAGVLNGWLNLRGKGTSPDRVRGEGKLVIAPAALYELPLFAQMFQMPKLQNVLDGGAIGAPAFQDAIVNFTVADSRFDLNSIDLQGDSINMRGRGFVRFDGGMKLDFGVSRRQIIPQLFRGGQWMGVKVTGNVGDPKTTYVPFPELEDGMRQFLNAFDPRRMTPRRDMGQTNNAPAR